MSTAKNLFMEKERERDRKKESVSVSVCMCAMCLCSCVSLGGQNWEQASREGQARAFFISAKILLQMNFLVGAFQTRWKIAATQIFPCQSLLASTFFVSGAANHNSYQEIK